MCEEKIFVSAIILERGKTTPAKKIVSFTASSKNVGKNCKKGFKNLHSAEWRATAVKTTFCQSALKIIPAEIGLNPSKA